MSETRGSGMKEPDSYKKDVLVQVWMDARILATLLNWMEKGENRPKFMSDVVREPIEMLVGRLVDCGEIRMIEDAVYARDLIEKRFKVNLNRGGRGKKNALNNMLFSDEQLIEQRRTVAEITRQAMEVLEGSPTITEEKEEVHTPYTPKGEDTSPVIK
jgi:hypothetical protein